MNNKGETNNFFNSSIFFNTKKGQGLSVNAIIMIVLGVFVLAVLILGFTMGWSNIKDRISPSNNVKTLENACGVACSTNSQFDYCTYPRQVKMSNDVLQSIKNGNDEVLVIKGKKYTCDELTDYPSLGISKCPSVDCSALAKSGISGDKIGQLN